MMNKTCSIRTGYSRFLPFVCLLTFLFVPTLATAQTTIFADSFDNGLLDSRWSSDWGQWASEGFNGTNNPPTLVPGNIPVPRPNDDPGKISTGVVGWTTLRADPENCDPQTQECFEMTDGVVSMDNVDISGVNDFGMNGVHMGLAARMEGIAPGPVQRAIMGSYLTAYNYPPAIYFQEFKNISGGTHGDRINQMVLPNRLETPIHMEMTLDGDDVEFTIGDSDEEYTINMVQGTFVHMHPYSVGPHIRPNPNPGRWGFFSMAALNTGTDYVTWDNFMLTSVPDVPDADLDTDGDYDGNDFLLGQQQGNPGSFLADWNAQYGTAPLSGVSAVPEPASVALIAMLFPLLGGFMRPSSRGA